MKRHIAIGILLWTLTSTASARIHAELAKAILMDARAALTKTGGGSAGANTVAVSRALAKGARYCVRFEGQTGCLFKSSNSAAAAVSDVIGPNYRVRLRGANLFEILDGLNNLVGLAEVLDRETHQGFDDLPALIPVQANSEPVYEVACGPGFAPSLPIGFYGYERPESFSQWNCSNGTNYYGAAGVCQPGKTGWRIWEVTGRRLGKSDACPD